MRRMISDKQLNELKSKNLKIIELDTGITNATITQEQMDIMFPKDAQGNIHKPNYYIVITDTLSTSGSGGFNYLGFWSPTSIRFNRLGTNGYYTWTIGPNDTKFTQTKTDIGGGGSEDFKIIKLNNSITSSTLTQEQINIIFPKDSNGNIYKPEYNILIYCNIYGTGVWYYLSTWTKNYVMFQLPGTDMSNKNFQLFPNKNKFEMFKQPLAAYQHNIYIKTNDLYIFLTIFGDDYTNFTSITDSYLLDQLNAHVACSGYISGAGLNAPITALRYNAPDSTFYFSAGENGRDYATFTANDVTEFTDEGKPFKIL